MKGKWRRKRQARPACSSTEAPGTGSAPAGLGQQQPLHLLQGTKRRKEVADPQNRLLTECWPALLAPRPSPAVAKASRQCPSLMDFRRISAPAPELCFWKSSQLSRGAEGLQALRELQPVPQADGILRREAQSGPHHHHQLPTPPPLTALLQSQLWKGKRQPCSSSAQQETLDLPKTRAGSPVRATHGHTGNPGLLRARAPYTNLGSRNYPPMQQICHPLPVPWVPLCSSSCQQLHSECLELSVCT